MICSRPFTRRFDKRRFVLAIQVGPCLDSVEHFLAQNKTVNVGTTNAELYPTSDAIGMMTRAARIPRCLMIRETKKS